jgi:DNA-binding PadR family transcriptional regulator
MRMRGDEEAWEGAEEQWRFQRGPHGRGRGGRHGHGLGPMPGMPPGPGMPRFGPPGFGPWPGERKFSRRPRVRRGDVRAAALALLAEEPRNGYQIIQEIAERSGGVWQPSPGSVYPALQQLEDEGLIAAESPEGGRRQYTLTSEGREYVEAHPDEVRAPWEVVAGSVGTDALQLRALVHQVLLAAHQVMQVGSTNEVDQARRILTETRRNLYRILASEETGQDDE